MAKDEKFIPIITLVVYCGTEYPWEGAKCLYDLLEIGDEMKDFVTNYRLNFYDCRETDTFDEYHTGLRQLFEVVRYSQDKEKLKEIVEKNREAYSRIDSETRDLLEVVAKVRIKEEYEPKIPNQLYICQPIASPKSSTISFWNAVIVV